MKDLTTGPLSRHLLNTTSYMLVSMIFQTMYVLVDLYWVGRLGTAAVAAVAISGNLLFIVVAATQMLGVGTTALVSHATGQRDQARARLVFNQAQVLSLIGGLVFLGGAAALRDVYTSALSADAETRRLANEYLNWFIPGLALQFGLVAMGAALRGTGNFRPGTVVMTATVILNAAMAPFLMFGWVFGVELGVAGAAVATTVSILVGIVWLALYFRPADSFLRFSLRDWKPRFRLWADLLKIGLPAGAEFALMAAYLLLVYAVSRPFGASAQAGFGIGGRILQACFMPIVALGFAVAPVAGQNFGARQGRRVKETFRVASLMAFTGMLSLAVVMWLASGPMMRVFTREDEVIRVGQEYLRVMCWSFVASGVIFVSSSMFQAMGNTMPSLVTSAVRIVLIAVPVLLLAGQPGFELWLIWYISVGATFLQLALNLLLLRREFRARLAFEPAAAA
jgi:putative MATE family efflux protein